MKEIMQTYGAMIVAVVVGIALLSGFGALKNKMSVAFAPQDILSSDSANDGYDSMKNIPVPGIELKEKMRQNAVSYSVYDLLDVTAHEDNLDKLEVYALYDRAEMTAQAAYQPMARHLAFRIMVCMICMSG